MTAEGPPLEALTRRLAECPPDFLAEPRIATLGTVHVDAVVGDLVRDLDGRAPDPAGLAAFASVDAQRDRNRLQLVLIACWLFHDPWFQGKGFGGRILAFLAGPTPRDVAAITPAGRFVLDDDRREELARTGLAALDLRPAGETEAQAADRLTTLSTVERRRVMAASRAAEERARTIREAMRQQAAREAAARHTRE